MSRGLAVRMVLTLVAAGAPACLPGTLAGAESDTPERGGPVPLHLAAHRSVDAERHATAVVDSLFPHARHEGLFPLCSGCHAGVETGDLDTTWPEAGSCDGCHDGVEQPSVEWSPPPSIQSTLSFTHPAHATAVAGADGAPLACAECHALPEGSRMAIAPLQPGGCLSCHGDRPADHMTPGTECASCHVAVAEVDGGAAWMADLGAPADHTDAFLGGHGSDARAEPARCATCHVQDRCVSCHVDPGLAALTAIPAAPDGWPRGVTTARYPVPASHTAADFEGVHGRLATEPAECSTCHTEDDCASCHLQPFPTVVDALVTRDATRAPGAGLGRTVPTSHRTDFFLMAHGILGGADPGSCATCHTETDCAACHAAPRAPGYHPSNFAVRHSAEAGRAASECSNCHETQTFCRTCHVEVGRGAVGRLGGGYHDAEPLWLLRHGQGARQNLETCASCHTQRDCVQCHGQLGAFKINPHGPDFDAARAAERNPWICRACHIGPTGVDE